MVCFFLLRLTELEQQKNLIYWFVMINKEQKKREGLANVHFNRMCSHRILFDFYFSSPHHHNMTKNNQ